MSRTGKRKIFTKGNRLPIIVVALAVVVVAVGAAGLFSSAGSIVGKILNIESSEEIVNPLTGEVQTEELAARPLVVSIDNVGDAVPQSWLSMADLVYEFPVEGNQTRLEAIYYSQFPDKFGPVRSTRPYFVDLTREYKAIFLAHGWSKQAKTYLMSGVVPYINAMNTDAKFYRDSSKAAPHNSYITWDEVKAKIDEEGWWSETQEIESFGFLSGAQKNEGETATFLDFKYSSSKFEFTYDSDTGEYTRTLNGKKYIDKETGESITCNNVLVQKVTSSKIDSYGRLSIDMCAGGEAILFTNGVAVKGTWSRADLDSRTKFVDTEGNEFKLTPGNTWVEVMDQNCTLAYN